MGNYVGHLTFGWYSHISISLLIIISLLLFSPIPFEVTIAITAISIPISLFGSILPDIDHHASKPNKAFNYVIFISTISITSLLLFTNIETLIQYADFVSEEFRYAFVLFIIITVSSMSGLLSKEVYAKYKPRHRGITHNPLFGLLFSMIISVLVFYFIQYFTEYYYIEISLISLIYFYGGFLSHLKLDNMLVSSFLNIIPSR